MIAGLFSQTGASHGVLVLGELGMMRLALSDECVDEIRRNLSAKLPEALPLFTRFLDAVSVDVYAPSEEDVESASRFADSKDVHVMAAAMGLGARFLVTHNARHFHSNERVRVIRPGAMLEKLRALMAGLSE